MNAKQRKIKPAGNEGLFDASASFERALFLSRTERGEPAEGLSRKIWESEKWVSENPLKFSGMILALGGIVGLAAWLTRRNMSAEPSEFKFKDSA